MGRAGQLAAKCPSSPRMVGGDLVGSGEGGESSFHPHSRGRGDMQVR